LIRAFLLFLVEGAVPKLLRWDNAFTGLDDYLAGKSTDDSALQKAAFEELLSPIAGLDIKTAASAWITPSMLKLFEREGAAIEMSAAARNQLAHLLAKILEVSVGSLEKAWGLKESTTAQVPDGTLPIPEPWPEPVDGAPFLDELLAEFLTSRFVVITEAQAIVCALYSVISYLTDHIDDNLPFLYITAGAKESGKTKLLELFFELVYHPDLSGNPSAASIYFALREGIYTILIDEVDRNEAHRESVLDLLNFSHTRRTAWVSRGDPEKGARVKYPTFCPKIIGGNGSIRNTTNSRCIRIQMIRKARGTPRIRITKKDRERFAVHRSKMMRLAQELGPKLRDFDWDSFQLPADLYNREADNWLLLFVVADLVGGEWPTLIRYAHHELCPPRSQDQADDINIEGWDTAALGEAFIRDVAGIWKETPTQEFYPSEDLRQKLKALKERPWLTMNKGLGVSIEKMGSLLRGFGVASVRKRIGGGTRHMGYLLTDLVALFCSYAPDIWTPTPDEQKSAQAPTGGSNPAHPGHPPADQVPEPIPWVGRVGRV
jgi:hypothetical protein